MAMWNLVYCTFVLLIVSFAIPHGASAVMEDEDSGESKYVHSGFYLGVGGTAAFPSNWSTDFGDRADNEASLLANGNAQFELDQIPPPGDQIIPVAILPGDAKPDDTMFGVNGVIGYRVGPLVAFEAEVEWLLTSSKGGFNVDSVDESVTPAALLQSSTGSHTVKVEDLWTITANVKIYPPFEGWLRRLERFQPFAKVGLGVMHSKFITDIETSGLTTTNEAGTVTVPADFVGHWTDTSTDAALRVGGGIDIYATRNIISEINATYVMPFTNKAPFKTDYVSVQLRLVYRF
jgi:hypothetical protein